MKDADVIIVGAGPVGLMLAAELRLAGVRPLVLERQSEPRDTPKANGLGGQILRLLRYRGLLEGMEEASPGPTHPAPVFPFGNIHLDFSHLDDPPMWGLSLPQPELERLLEEHARELGAEIRRGNEVIGLSQDDGTVTADVSGPDGRYQATARYLVGCDGPSSRVRDLTGIGFPGTTYPEVNRLVQATLHPSVTLLESGDLDVPGMGRVEAGFTRTDGGVFAFGPLTPEVLMFNTIEEEAIEHDDEEPVTETEFQGSMRRVLGGELPLGEVTRLSRWQFQARQADRYRDGRIFLAGDAAHLFPSTGIGLSVGMLDSVNLAWKLAAEIEGWSPAGLLETYHDERQPAGARGLLHTEAQVALRRGLDPAADALRELFLELVTDEAPLRRMGALLAGTDVRYPLPDPGSDAHPLTGTFAPDLDLRTGQDRTSVAELMRPARPILLDLADRADIRDAARGWGSRIEIHTAETDARPADAVLVRPDAHIAWAAKVDQPADTAVPALREALSRWFGKI